MPKTVIAPLKRVLYSGYIAEGPQSKLFETEVGKWIGNHKIAVVNSGTSALALALHAADVRYGDEVISTAQTCLATNEPILNLGANVVWADVDPSNGNIDPKSIESCITEKTKAIMMVHWTGIPCEIKEILAIAKKHSLKVIEDAAHAFGAEYNGERVGNHSDFVCFSFQAIKHLTTGDGGAICCKSEDDLERIKLLRWFGAPRIFNRTATQWDVEVKESGYKMHLNDIAATIGLEQLKYVDKIVKAHQKNGKYLHEEISKIKGMAPLRILPNSVPGYWIFGIVLSNPKLREKFSEYLTLNKIGNSVVHIRNDSYQLFASSKKDLPNLDDFSSRMINIPCGWWLNDDNLDYIVKTCKDAMKSLGYS